MPRDNDKNNGRPPRREGGAGAGYKGGGKGRSGGPGARSGGGPRGEKTFGDRKFGDKRPAGDKRPYAARAGAKPYAGKRDDFRKDGDRPASRPRFNRDDRPQRDDRGQGQEPGEKVSIGRGHREAGRERRSDHGGHEEDHPQVPDGVEREQGLQGRVKRERGQPGRHVPRRHEPVDEEAQQDLEPEEALRRLVAFTFDHHLDHESYIRLVMSENIHRGQYLAQSPRIQELNVPAIAAIRNLYERGVKTGVFRKGLDPVDIHASISALSFFNVSNRHTFGLIFKLDMTTRAYIAQRRDNVVEMIVRFMRKV